MNKKVIGVIDSGIGGLSIVREINKLLPDLSVNYLQDKENFPYGDKTPDQLKRVLSKNVAKLLEQKPELIVIACNTATVNTIIFLRQKFPNIEFVGLEPAIKPAAKICQKGMIILSSPKTTQSQQLKNLIKLYAKNLKVFNLESLELVKAVEKKWSESKTLKLLKTILPTQILDQADVLVLGCTHFPLIKNIIQKHVSKKIKIVDSSQAVAKQVKKKLLLC